MRTPGRSSRRWAGWLGAAFAGVVGLSAQPSAAYVRSLNTSGNAVFWSSSCVPMQVFPEAFDRLTGEQTVQAATEAARVWSKDDPLLAGCTYLAIDITSTPAGSGRLHAKFDHRNVIVIRSDTWCPENEPDAPCYDPAELARTTLWSHTDGELVDVDIQVNNVDDYEWGDLVSDFQLRVRDLQNALTHELGHVIGLDHTCYAFDPAHPRPNDDMGNPVPDCDLSSTDVMATTMYPSASIGDIEKRTPEADDRRGVCELYPLASDPGVCVPPNEPGGCACAVAREGEGHSTAALALVAAVAAGLGRRRRRRAG